MRWLDADDADRSVYAFLRSAPDAAPLVIVANLTPAPRDGYRLGLPGPGVWRELLNSDADVYGGGGRGNLGQVTAEPVPAQGQGHSAPVHLPPLSVLIFGQS
jgi:1,4-alpha-glucan branching enzyme